MKAEIISTGNGLAVSVDGKTVIPAAYMSYLPDKADYDGFIKAGYDLYCCCVFMGDCTINELSGVRPFARSVWKSEDEYDFSPVAEAIKKVVAKRDRKVYVILRVNLNAPAWWREKYPEELTLMSDGKRYMQSVFSERWLSDSKKFIGKLDDFIENSEFSESVIGYQLAAMQTEEWIAMCSPDGELDFSEPARKAYKTWVKNGGNGAEEPDFPPFTDFALRTAKASEYLEFFNEGFASAICGLCSFAKQKTGDKRLIGVFYGYIGQLPANRGHCAFSRVLESPFVDFFASPFSYAGSRQTAEDWFYHGATESVKRKGKLWFMEADVRTFRTKKLYETDPGLMSGEHTVKYFDHPVFTGPKNLSDSLAVMLKAFSKVLISGNAFWWFDMWGGWYSSRQMMTEIARMAELYKKSFYIPTESVTELAVVLNEKASYHIPDDRFSDMSFGQLRELGFIGAPYDLYASGDDVKKYKAALYILPDGDENVLRSESVEIRKKGVFSHGEITAFIKSAGAHIYSEGNIVYANSRFVALTAREEGRVTLETPREVTLSAFYGKGLFQGKKFDFYFRENHTELFEIL